MDPLTRLNVVGKDKQLSYLIDMRRITAKQQLAHGSPPLSSDLLCSRPGVLSIKYACLLYTRKDSSTITTIYIMEIYVRAKGQMSGLIAVLRPTNVIVTGPFRHYMSFVVASAWPDQ